MLSNRKYNRPDTPLASTPEPFGMQQEREKQAIDSVKGSSLRLMQEKKAKEKAESASKSAKEANAKNAMSNAAKSLKNLKPSDF